jgi:hypothetical protein
MGAHATIHGKTTTETNGQSGKWVPIQTNDAGQISIAELAGELATYNRMAGGSIVQYLDISADGVAVTGPCIVYGVKCISGTTPTFIGYDNVTASGTAMITTGTATAETFYPLLGLNAAGSTGVICSTGFYADVGGTSPVFRLFYVSAV